MANASGEEADAAVGQLGPQDELPEVVAVVVTSNSGDWLDECLRALAAQDYEHLSVLVIDAGSREDPTSRIAACVPNAFIRRLPTNPGFGPAVNEVLTIVQGASHYLVCHDDVAPDPDAVRLMLEECYRSNAGIVAPKLVAWDDPSLLLAVGILVDKSGAPEEQVGRGEPDHEQYDAVRDVFVAPGGCTLVRADLFDALGGFDPEITMFGEDLDLCWRAQVAGARVVVAPSARVRHLEAASAGKRAILGSEAPADSIALTAAVRPLQLRHRLRAVLKNYSPFHLIRVMPQLAVLAVAEMAFGVATRHREVASATWQAWRWNFRKLGDLRPARKAVQRQRTLPDGEIRRLQSRGSARIAAFLRGQLSASNPGQAIAEASRDFAVHVRQGDLRVHFAVWSVLTIVLIAGSRHLITRRLPQVGQFMPLPESPFTLLHHYVSGWRSAGLGSESPAPVAFAILGFASTALLGATGVVQKLLVLGCLPVGLVGAHRLARPLESDRAPLVAVVAYAALPLPYNALATGRLGGLISYAVMPWALAAMARASRMAPFAPSSSSDKLARDSVPFGVLLAVAAAFAPSVMIAVLVLAVGLVGGSLLAGGMGGAFRALAVTGFAVVVAAGLLFPWSLEFVLPGAEWPALVGFSATPDNAIGLAELLRFQSGPMGAGVTGYGVMGAAALALLLGRTWRLQWAIRLWLSSVVVFAITWVLVRGWVTASAGSVEVFLAPAGASLALAVAVGVAVFESELRGYRFGWRQLAAIAAGGALAAGCLPLVGEAFGGRWNSPRRDHAQFLTWMRDHRREGAFRVLWVGDPQALPGDGWHVSRDIAYTTSREGPPDATNLWAGSSEGATRLLADAVAVARRGDTTHLGRLVAPMAVRYIAVPLRDAPEGGRRRPPDAQLLTALQAQTDLARRDTHDSLVVYENAAWIPGRALLGAEASAVVELPLARGLAARLAPAEPALAPRTAFSFRGSVADDANVYFSESASPRWRMDVAGEKVRRERAFGWANTFTVGAGGRAELAYDTAVVRYGALAAQAALWLVAIATMLRWRRARPV